SGRHLAATRSANWSSCLRTQHCELLRKFSRTTAFHRPAFISSRTNTPYSQYCGKLQNWIMSARIAACTQALTTVVRRRYLAWMRVNLELATPGQVRPSSAVKVLDLPPH